MSQITETEKPSLARRLPLLVILTVALVGALTLRDQLSFDALADHREALIGFRDANYAGTVLGFVVAYVVIVAFSLPGATIATLAGGFLFGVFPGVLYNVTAATIGAILIFLAARWGLGDRLAARVDASEGRVKRLREGLRENELSVLFLIRLVPAVPFFVANLLPALVGVALGRFALTTFFGIMPGALVYTWVGAGLGTVFARGETPDLGIIFEPHVLGPLLGLAALAALPMILRIIRRRRA
ncbi:Uncharacterized membrane protein YdjX, TVP38/TMEM64 family, SNARE-associated domain [Rhodovulum sp. ES.010]|uniref:TVP38/TMEM64 family protein n=1 Tax=Rhodovulum sp. ES.010 TaxID=1882821 RepID=UPI00092A5F51|nr:TVP38/TMEM64 family protein [Rhodovulum sp. ES.010]SIO42278.1 Uncharacterized membrane protein YdjX, TVP38/TMEM64 family, SNARE-associated domain [Rhodovulum sp. ES.010]